MPRVCNLFLERHNHDLLKLVFHLTFLMNLLRLGDYQKALNQGKNKLPPFACTFSSGHKDVLPVTWLFQVIWSQHQIAVTVFGLIETRNVTAGLGPKALPKIVRPLSRLLKTIPRA